MMSPHTSFVELLRERARLHPERLAFSFLLDGETENARLTYGELDTRARAIAVQLRRRGPSPPFRPIPPVRTNF